MSNAYEGGSSSRQITGGGGELEADECVSFPCVGSFDCVSFLRRDRASFLFPLGTVARLKSHPSPGVFLSSTALVI